jgi:hypothetical protein
LARPLRKSAMVMTSSELRRKKLVESFPTDEQQQIRVQLAGSLKLIVSQLLVPHANGRTRVGAFEILKSTSPVRAIIRDGKTYQLGSAMQIGRSQGMLTIDASLEQLLTEGKISFETAYQYAQKKELFTKAARAGGAPQAAAPSSPDDSQGRPVIPTDVSSVAEAPRHSVQPMQRVGSSPDSIPSPRMQPQQQPLQRPNTAQPMQPQQPLQRPNTGQPMQPPGHVPPLRQAPTVPAQPAARQAQPAPQPSPAAPPAATPAAAPGPPPARKRISIPRDE